MKAIRLSIEQVDYITISAQHATEMFDTKINLYLEKGWRKHQDQPDNKGNGFKVNLYKPGYQIMRALAEGENINEYDEFIHAFIKEKHPGFTPILSRSENKEHLEIVLLKSSIEVGLQINLPEDYDKFQKIVKQSFQKLDNTYQSMGMDFGSKDEGFDLTISKEGNNYKVKPKVFDKPDQIKEDFVSEDKHLEGKSKYIYFEDGDSAEVAQWANQRFKEGYRLIGGISPKLFAGESHMPLFIYHATMVYDETV